MIHNLTDNLKPTNIYHHCSYPKCNAKINNDNHFCSKHWKVISKEYKDIKNKTKKRPSNRARQLASQKDYNNTKRDKQANRFYHTQQWQRARNYVLQRDLYACQVCGNNYQVNRLTADHITPRRYCGDINRQLAPNNLWTLCNRCNGIKQYLEKQLDDKYKDKAGQQFRKISREEWATRIKRIRDRKD
ncbi:HNH endonuclease [Lactobacillus sp. ESL0225]|uniref:HNH endonuclease n=1 Tax=Lactobacillus sp. ESL0225 TaxID=2069351 RepID=UPI000EFC584D|nr:HNH endonuclease [Lactobacillus sp. ESL0225]